MLSPPGENDQIPLQDFLRFLTAQEEKQTRNTKVKTGTPEWDAPEQDAQGLCGTVNSPEPSLAMCQMAQSIDTLGIDPGQYSDV